MDLKNEILTLENGFDYLVYDSALIDDVLYYLLFKVVDEEVTDELLILSYKSDDLLETIDDEVLFNKVKSYFLKAITNKEHNVPTVHMKANYGEIAPLVIMPGDPLRAKYIAEKYLENAVLVNDVRGILAYTGYYNKELVTVMAAGMGMPSAGIYYHELFKFYDVQKIIRIGTCGATIPEEKLLDLVIANKAYTNSNFASTYSGHDTHYSYPSYTLTNKLKKSCGEKNYNYHLGGVFTMDFFGPYINVEKLYEQIPPDFDKKAEEMECFGLLHIADVLGKEAACILTIVDSPFCEEVVSSEEREAGLNKMIIVALDAITDNKI